MKRLVLWISLTVIGIILAIPAAAQTNEQSLIITWVTDTTLSVWQGETGETISLELGAGLSRPTLSPAARQIVYQHDQPEGENGLWLTDIQGRTPQLLMSLDKEVILGQLFWIDETTIAFNFYRREPPMGFQFEAPVTIMNVSSGESSTISPGGFMSLNPSRNAMTLSEGGSYGEEQGIIRYLNLTDGSDPVDLHTFDALATASHQPFLPQVYWLDDESFIYALPEPDALYLEGNQPITLHQISIDGTVEIADIIETDLFGMPRWSPDGEHMLYLRTATADNPGDTTQMVLAGTDDETVVGNFPYGTIFRYDWLDNDHYFFFYNDGLWLGQMDGEAALWQDVPGVFYTRAGGVLVFATLAEPMQVVYALPGQNEPTAIAEVSIVFGIDAILRPNP